MSVDRKNLRTYADSVFQLCVRATKSLALTVAHWSRRCSRNLRNMLEVQSYAVETATSGHDALLRFQSGYRPGLVLLDVNMPGMDGLESLAKLRTVDSAVDQL